MLLGLSSSGKVTKLNIVSNPFRKSHCPSSPLSVCKMVSVVFTIIPVVATTVDHPKDKEFL